MHIEYTYSPDHDRGPIQWIWKNNWKEELPFIYGDIVWILAKMCLSQKWIPFIEPNCMILYNEPSLFRGLPLFELNR